MYVGTREASLAAPERCNAEDCGRELLGPVRYCPFCGHLQSAGDVSGAPEKAVSSPTVAATVAQSASVGEPADAVPSRETEAAARVGESVEASAATRPAPVQESTRPISTPSDIRPDGRRRGFWLGLSAILVVVPAAAYYGYLSLSQVGAEAQERAAAMEEAQRRALEAEEAARQAQAEQEAWRKAQAEADALRRAQEEADAQRRLQEAADARQRAAEAQAGARDPGWSGASPGAVVPGGGPTRNDPEPRTSPAPVVASVAPADLQAAVESAIRTAGVSGVTAQVKDDLTITLKGSLSDPGLKDRAFQAARAVARGHPVKDRVFIVEQ
ncbi:MAG: hypothetical protein HY778_14585 [Betaproteobacteria bacterium]|nr:hypothetical protein [Betaproteobacteria bacterium]